MGRVFGLLFNAACWSLVVAIPLLGVWFGSSLAAYWNGPTWIAVVSGLLFFPILPVAWELRYQRKRRGESDEEKAQRLLTWSDRLILRTLAINLLFVGLLLWQFPTAGFTALSTRGDWMLDDQESPGADRAREALFWSADKLEWLYSLAHENPYRNLAEGEEPEPESTKPEPESTKPEPESTKPEPESTKPEPESTKPEPESTKPEPESTKPEPESTKPEPESTKPEPESTKPEPESTKPSGKRPASSSKALWPLASKPHPLAESLPKQHATTPEAVGRYLAQREKDPYQLVKALHDWAALNIAYDFDALINFPTRCPPQNADAVFKAREGVCAGYANLMTAMGKAAGVVIVYVSGDSRDMLGDVNGAGHAWNAAKINGQWHLMDVTWNAGHGTIADGFTRNYRTDYLFTPPEVFVTDHFPDDAFWQQLDDPISRGSFMRKPMLRPAFHAAGLELVYPRRSQVTLAKGKPIQLANPGGKYVLARLRRKGDTGQGERVALLCEPGSDALSWRCEFSSPGTYQLQLFVSDVRYGQYQCVGQVEVNSRG